MSWIVLLQLAAIVAPLSLVAVGGANTIIPELHRQVVDVHGWMSDAEFVEMYALAQVAPGPNAQIVSLVGWKVAGWPGGLVAMLAFIAPSGLLAYLVTHAGQRLASSPWVAAIQAGLGPIAVGMVLASGAILSGAASRSPLAFAVTAATALLVLRTNVQPLLLMLVGALLAVAGWL